jgi:16S rRNA (adenine1518-N6/adenine1519-N6)-dimethyltransferase
MFLETKNKPKLMVFMVQKEVGQRICAKPPDMNLLAVSVQFFAEPKIVSFISKGAFWPRPKVDSAILKIVPKKELSPVDSSLFFYIVKAGFKQPRKQLVNNLMQGLKLKREEIETWLHKAGIQPTKRAETLSLKDWVSLTKSLP